MEQLVRYRFFPTKDEEDPEEWINSGNITPVSFSMNLNIGATIGYIDAPSDKKYGIVAAEILECLSIFGATPEEVEKFVNKEAQLVSGRIICADVMLEGGYIIPAFLCELEEDDEETEEDSILVIE